MELLAELSEKDVGIGKGTKMGDATIQARIKTSDKDISGCYRAATRAVVLNSKKEMALLHLTKYGCYYKLPGGGINKGESRIAALHREVLEEIGCRISVLKPVGLIIEHRDRIKITQLSFCYLARLKGKPGETDLDEGERALGFKPEWWSTSKALSLVENSPKPNYMEKFMVERDALFIRKALKLASGKA
jgi:ADP-ribose pyrophosphatase YjhB (NUDIX family)